MKFRRTKHEGSATETAGPSGLLPGSTSEAPSGPSSGGEETDAPSLNEGISADELALVEEREREVRALEAKPSRKLEVLIAITLVILSTGGIIASGLISLRTETGGIDPRWWPTVLCVITLVLALMLTVVSLTRPPFDREDLEVTNRGGWYRLVWTIILSALFVVAWTLSGNFVIPAMLLLVILMWIYDGRGWKALVIYPVGMIVGIYLLFHTLLKVPL